MSSTIVKLSIGILMEEIMLTVAEKNVKGFDKNH